MDTSIDQALRAILEGTASETGAAFFHSLVRHLAEVLGIRFAFVAEFTDLETRSRVRSLAFWIGDGFLEDLEYDLAGTPCMQVAQGKTVYCTHDVCARFPNDKGLAAMGVESYFGVPLVDSRGVQLGHLAVMDDKPMNKEFRGMAILKIFAARAMAELERRWFEQALQESEARLAGTLENAIDAIITIDSRQQITLFNAAAEKMFHHKAKEMLGQPVAGLLSPSFHALLEERFTNLANTADEVDRRLWAPEGLLARRADGGEFAVEATISPARVNSQPLCTLILRDLSERQRAEEALNKLRLENVYLREVVEIEHDTGGMIGESPAIHRVFEHLTQVAPTDATVLLTGETGTGKEMLARAIHRNSPRKSRLLVTVNCAALPSELIESELFGHEKGAFTGATSQRKGRFEMADGGTLFLDEVGELSASAQAKLLRVLQEQTFERVGGSRSLKVNVRVVAATNRDLAQMVKAGAFRADLFYRLNVFPIQVPPLRERHGDIPLLANFFLRQLGRKMGKAVRTLSQESMARLTSYSWPGNVRELQNIIERAVILAGGPVVDVDTGFEPRSTEAADGLGAQSLLEVERAHVLRVLQSTQWTIEGERGAARILGINPSTLRSRLRKLNIRKPGIPV